MKKQMMVALAVSVMGWPLVADAHKRWLLPTDFSLSDAEQVSVDFTASNNLFYVDKGMPADGVEIIDPTGNVHAPINPVLRKRRSVFDVDIDKEGTYRVVSGGKPMYFSSYQVPGEEKPSRGRGALDELKAKIPANATDVKFSESVSLLETYITLGAPSKNFGTSGQGIELVGGAHPNTLYADEPSRFVFNLNGKPAKGLTVEVTPDGTRYRDEEGTVAYTLDGKGAAEVNWSVPGRYLLEVGTQVEMPEGSEIAKRYYSYSLTVEVLKP
ncbi:DUF4198 domain-containing protein [uncultured Gilvimarinus sp.]|jgi:uncharacterized GH25 family protein|uniref:DUF4198 domain-containing protein n=1 Tax=uncultured Gilvimarinus sp. TaxID=1689143 RepID=UPI0030DDC750